MSGVLGMMLLGGARIVLGSDTIHAVVVHPGTATASFFIGNSTSVVESPGGSYTWLTGGLPSNYEILATLNSGSASGDSFGTWLNLGGAHSWGLSRSSIGISSSDVTFQIRQVGTTTVLATATITFTAEVE